MKSRALFERSRALLGLIFYTFSCFFIRFFDRFWLKQNASKRTQKQAHASKSTRKGTPTQANACKSVHTQAKACKNASKHTQTHAKAATRKQKHVNASKRTQKQAHSSKSTQTQANRPPARLGFRNSSSLKRASRSIAKTGFFDGSKSIFKSFFSSQKRSRFLTSFFLDSDLHFELLLETF